MSNKNNKKRQAESEKKKTTKKTVASSNVTNKRLTYLSGVRNSLVNRYFDDIAKFDGFDGDEDIRSARHIARMEQELWQRLFTEPEKAALVAETALGLMSKGDFTLNETEFSIGLLEQLLGRLNRCRTVKGRRLTCLKLADQVADQLYASDTDRQLIDGVTAVLRRTRPKAGRMDGAPYQTFKRELNNRVLGIKAAKRRFIESHLSLVVSIARGFYKGQMPLLDLIQEGNLGLIKAVDRYDYTKGFRFVTYATWWIRATIGRAITDKGQAVRVPANTYHTRARIDRAAQAIRAKQGRAPTRDELQAETGLSQGSLTRIRETGSVVVYSLDQRIPGTEDHTYVDLL